MSITKDSLQRQKNNLIVGTSSRDDGEQLKLNIHRFISQQIPGTDNISELLLAEFLQEGDDSDDDDDDDDDKYTDKDEKYNKMLIKKVMESNFIDNLKSILEKSPKFKKRSSGGKNRKSKKYRKKSKKHHKKSKKHHKKSKNKRR